jgi:ubiquitin-protein ligase
MAMKRLRNEYKEWSESPCENYSICPDENNFLNWNIMLILPDDTIFEGLVLKCSMEFSTSYPNKPPSFKFEDNNFIHPNIYLDGKMCISILHEGVDEFGYENQSERWNPSHSVNSILMSIIVVLSNPNLDSPANLDATIMWRDNYDLYKKFVYDYIANN